VDEAVGQPGFVDSAARSRQWRERGVIHDHMNIWLLRPGVGGFGDLPTLLDDTDKRGGTEQFGERWQPIDQPWRLEGSALRDGGHAFELLGAVRLPAANELVMVFEDGFVAIVQSDRTFEVSRIQFEVRWIELPKGEKPKGPPASAPRKNQGTTFYRGSR
jgi:hypothetical protein